MEPQENNPQKWDGLQTRIISGVALAIVAVFCLCVGGVIFNALVIFAAALMIKEWKDLAHYQMLLLQFAGYPVIILPCACIIWLRGLHIPADDNLGLTLVAALISVVTATDVGAYFTGKRLGRHKLAPTISPNKTWEGLAGGVIAAMFVSVMFLPYVHIAHSFSSALIIGLFLALLAQAGDLFESWLKRLAGAKDSGNIIPGHGGVLDRFDGYLFTTPLLCFIIYCVAR